MDITAAVLHEPGGDFTLERVSVGELRPDELLVQVHGTGLCHTDLLFRDGVYDFPLPCVLGHEGAGVVLEVGAEVRRVRPGDHVVLSAMYCGVCDRCRNGQTYLCRDIFAQNFGGRGDGTSALSLDGWPLHAHFDGQSSLASHAVSNARNTILVDRDAPIELLGPLGCGVLTGAGAVAHTFRPRMGQSIAVFGAGPVGMSAVMAAVVSGCHPIIAVEPHENRRQLALELGATMTLDPATDDVQTAIAQATRGGVDFALDTTGRPAVIRTAVESLASGGLCGVLGGSPMGTELVLDLNNLLFGGRRIQGINMGDCVAAVFVPKLVELHLAGRFPFDRMTRSYPLDQVNQAVRDSESGAVLKPILHFDHGSQRLT